jgi:hypothetical protein
MATTAATIAATTAATSAAANNARRQREEKARCEKLLPDFDAQTATVAEMRDYAHCVGIVYPPEGEPIGAAGLLLIGALFVWMLYWMFR